MILRTLARGCAALGLVAMALFAGVPAMADTPPTDPAARQIAVFTDTLLDTMRQAKQLGISGRFNRLKPVVEQTFDIPTMTRLAVGPSWSSLSAADQQALTAAFERMTLANYARNFDSYSGEKFVIDPNVQSRNEDRIVQTTMVLTHDAPVPFIYRMRQNGGTWKVIDIFLNGYVSELATRRSDFSSTIASGGSAALLKQINNLSDKLMAGA
jgi:phospholipid transport system substrate-binding protein